MNLSRAPVPSARDDTVKAAVIMSIGMMFIPLGDTFAKLASEQTTYDGTALAWARLLLGAVVVGGLAAISGAFKTINSGFWPAQLVRGSLFAGTIVCIITAVGMIPLADAFGAFFIGPVIATILARLVLGEAVRNREWVAVAVGFLGVLLVVKPGVALGQGQLWALAAGFCYGGYLTSTRWAKAVGPPFAQLAGQLIVGASVLTPFAISHVDSWQIQAPGLLLGSGFSSAMGNLLVITAFGFSRAAALAPLVYVQLVAAVALGWIVFDTVPDLWTAAGLLIVFLSGLSPLLRR